jgi:hypothetical protein
MSSTNLEKDEDFKRAFWAWFDTLNKEEKHRFWYYQLDMAKIYFYNKHYAKIRANKLEDDELSSARNGLEVSPRL